MKGAVVVVATHKPSEITGRRAAGPLGGTGKEPELKEGLFGQTMVSTCS